MLANLSQLEPCYSLSSCWGFCLFFLPRQTPSDDFVIKYCGWISAYRSGSDGGGFNEMLSFGFHFSKRRCLNFSTKYRTGPTLSSVV